LSGTAAFFESVGFPGFLAYPVTAIEIGGGILLVLGLATQWAALAMVPVLLGAVTVHFGNGWTFNAPNGGWEFPLFLAVVALGQATLGTDGALSVGARLNASRARPGADAVASAA
jgi:putative oxidoreductase